MASQRDSLQGSNRDKLLIISPAHSYVACRHVRNDHGGPNEGAKVMTGNTLRAWTIDADCSCSRPAVDPFDCALVASCGATPFNLRVVSASFGLPVGTATLPQATEPDILARRNLPNDGSVAPELNELCASTSRGATNRIGPTLEPVPLLTAKFRYQASCLNPSAATGGAGFPQRMGCLGCGPSGPRLRRRRLKDVLS